MKRDPRIQPRRPQIRNFRDPEPDEATNRETPWDRLERMVEALEEQRAERVIGRVKQACFDQQATFREVIWTAYEAITEATNEELRQVLTTAQHRLQLSLMQTDPDEPPLSREEAWNLLEAIKQSATLVDAQAPRDDIACAFLDLDPIAVELSDLVVDHLENEGLESTVDTSLQAAPVHADGDRLGEAVIVFLESLLDHADDEQPIVRVRWSGEEAIVFVGTDPPVAPKHELQHALNRPASLRDPDLDLPLARSVVRSHHGEVLVHETADGAVGFCCVLPALEAAGP